MMEQGTGMSSGAGVHVGAGGADPWKRFGTLAGLAVLLALPWFLEDFTTFQITQALVYATAILGLNLLTGFGGQLSLGHSAFYALGAYTAAILINEYQLAYYWTPIPAGLVCLVAGFLFGLPALRLKGLYLALATFALAVATPQLLKYDGFQALTGGVQGIELDKPVSPLTALSDDQWLYYFVLMVSMALFLWASNLIHSRTGRAVMAIRDNPIAAEAMGIHVSLYKSLTFGVSALYTGTAGALGAIIVQFVAPDSFTFMLAVTFLVGSVIGGITSIPGAVFGGFFVLLVPNLAETIAGMTGRIDAKGFSWAVYGVFLILTVYGMPAGAAGVARRLLGVCRT